MLSTICSSFSRPQLCADSGIKGEVLFVEHISQYAELAKKQVPALIIGGKYSMRAFGDSANRFPAYKPDVVGVYNEWTWAQARQEWLQGVIMEPAEPVVRTAVRNIIQQISDGKEQAVVLPSRFYRKENFADIHVIDLANQRLDLPSSR